MHTTGRPLTAEEKKETAKRFTIDANKSGLLNTDLHCLTNRRNFLSVKIILLWSTRGSG